MPSQQGVEIFPLNISRYFVEVLQYTFAPVVAMLRVAIVWKTQMNKMNYVYFNE